MALWCLAAVAATSTIARAEAVPEVLPFAEWKAIFRPEGYRTLEEHDRRSAIYAKTVLSIEAHNEKAKESGATYRLGVNALSDLTASEFRRGWLGYIPPTDAARTGAVQWLNGGAAEPIDWRTKGAVTPVKDQRGCGSCWTFSATGAMEGHYQIATGVLRSLSEQEIVDCFNVSNGHGTGCEGGEMRQAFSWVINNRGIDSEQDYNYTGIDGVCWTNATRRDVATFDSWTAVPLNDEAQLAAAVQLGPVSVAIEADQASFQSYKSGVYNGPCGTKVDHGVLVVGLTDTAYIVKNSWGSSWGEKGYLLMERNIANKTGLCGIAMQASYPVKKPGPAVPVPPSTPGERPGLNHFCGCPADEGECSLLGQHCCCYEAKSGDISCQQKPVTSESQCCKPCH